MVQYSKNDLDPLFVIECDHDGEVIKLHTNTSGLSEFIEVIDLSLKSRNEYPICIDSKITSLLEMNEEVRTLGKVEIYKEQSSENKQVEKFQLSFEWNEQADSVEIHGDDAGLVNLKKYCSRLANKPYVDHEHLMGPEWGGTELTDRCFHLNGVVARHVKIIKWD